MTKKTWSAEGARRLVLRLLDVAGGFEQAVQAAGGRAALGEEQVRTVEFAHVADPVRLEDGFAAGNWQRMESPDRTLRILLEIVEEWRVEAILHAFQNAKVQLQKLLNGIEDSADHIGVRVSGHLLHVAIGHQVEIKLGPDPLQDVGEAKCGKVGLRLRAHRGHQGAEHGRVMARAKRKAFVDHDGGKIGVQDGRAERVLETADDDRFIDERVDRTPQLAPFRAEPRPIVGGNAGDDQDFEIRTVRPFPPERRRQQIGNIPSAIIVQIPLAGMLAEGPCRQRLHNPR